MSLTAVAVSVALSVSLAGPGPEPAEAVCLLVLHEERVQLENAERTVEVARRLDAPAAMALLSGALEVDA